MRTAITKAAIAAILLPGFVASVDAQVNSSTWPYGTNAGSSTQKPGPSDSAVGRPGIDALGAGDPVRGNWAGTNPGVSRRTTGEYPVYGPGYTGSPVAPGGNGALGAGDLAIGNWTGTNPGVDRRSTGGPYFGSSFK
jgi:hypothetical protein